MLGFVAGIFLLIFLMVMIISIAVSTIGDEKVTVSEKSVLHLRFDHPLRDRTVDNPLENFDFSGFDLNNQPGLNDILKSIDNASRDEKIKGIFIDVPSIQGGIASVEEVRNALLKFKKSGKFIYAFGDYYTQGAYYLASVADQIYMHPQGQLMINGMATELMFFKGTLEKLELEPQVIRHGKFKSAVEPFLLDKMSDENRKQIAGFIDPIWKHVSDQICKARKTDPATFKKMVDGMELRNAKDALKLKMVDRLAFYDEFLSELNKKAGRKADEEPEFISLSKYRKAPATSTEGGLKRDKIAVIYASGEIGNGEGNDNNIGSDRLSEAIREARKDDKIKAIVLRVNSPGGDALASDEIWREVMLARKAKPLMVSMGDLAASGGYYISCAADQIVAQPNTLTGSIGVFGLLFNAEKTLRNKLGITTDLYKTNPYTDIGTVTRKMTPAEESIMQQSVDEVYSVFTSRVAEGRKMSVAEVDSIGQGRVWSGIDAMKIGLVDTLGGLDVALALAAKKAGLKDYRIIQLPEQKDPFEMILQDMSAGAKSYLLKSETGDAFRYLSATNSLLKYQGIQALTPYRLTFD